MFTFSQPIRPARALWAGALMCVSLTFCSLPVRALDKSIPMYGGQMTDFRLVEASAVKLEWPAIEQGYGPMPTLEEGQRFAIVSVKLKPGASIGVLDYRIGGETALALSVNDKPFSPEVWEVKLKPTDPESYVELLYKVDNDPEFIMEMAYEIPTIKSAYRMLRIDLRPPVDPNAPAPVVLPEDYAFTFLTGQTEPIDLATHLTDTLKAVDVGADLVRLESGTDTVTGANGLGLKVVKEGETMMWTPATLACYRAGDLLGVWDQATSAFRAATPGEVPDKLPGLGGEAEAVPAGDAVPAVDGAAPADPKAEEPVAAVEPKPEAKPEAAAPKAEPKPAVVDKKPATTPKPADTKKPDAPAAGDWVF